MGAARSMMPSSFVCPACKGSLTFEAEAYRCAPCRRVFPVIQGIPDFRIEADPYIPIPEDRAKALHLAEQARTRTFEQLVRYYYSITPDDPPDLAERWTAHALGEVSLARFVLEQAGVLVPPARGNLQLLDLGCSTGGLVLAAHHSGWRATGVDIALRWLIVGQKRLEEAGVSAPLVCASAARLPFAGKTFGVVTGTDLLEHVSDAGRVLAEAHRVSAPGATGLFTANNRYAPLVEPQMRLWGVGYLPRSWQAAYVSARRPDVHRYRITLPGARELERLCRGAGYTDVRVDPSPLHAPHVESPIIAEGLRLYNRVRLVPGLRAALLLAGPKLTAIAGPRAGTAVSIVDGG